MSTFFTGWAQENWLNGRKNSGRAFAKADPHSAALTVTAYDECVKIFRKFPFSSIAQTDRLGAAPGKFEQASVFGGFGAANGTAGHKIAHIQVAAIHGMVGKLLLHRPIHVFIIRTANEVLFPVSGLQKNFKLYV